MAGDEFGPASRTADRELVRDDFGPGMRYDFELVERIAQEPSGKYRFCVSKVAADRLAALTA